MLQILETPRPREAFLPLQLQEQQTSYDCGHTCLRMLGYDDRKLPKRALSMKDIWSVVRSKDLHFFPSWDKASFPDPHLLLIQKKSGSYHWVIRLEDKIICPKRGVYEAKTYLKQNVESVVLSMQVPQKRFDRDLMIQ